VRALPFSSAALALSFALLSGCGGAAATSGETTTPAEEETTTTTTTTEATPTPTTFEEQVALGGQLYGENCAGCHGASGEGTEHGPRVVGIAEGALPLDPRPGSHRTAQFRTVADVATFAVATMPPSAPGSLSADQYWAILAFDLHANGIDLDQPLTPELAQTLEIPR
jgi:mono/diheme cytochrome c family protein